MKRHLPTIASLITEQMHTENSGDDKRLANRLIELNKTATAQHQKNIANKKRVQDLMVDFVRSEKLDVAAKTGIGSDIQVEQNVIVDFFKGADEALDDIIQHYEHIAMAAEILYDSIVRKVDPEPEVVESILYDFSNTLGTLGFTDVFKAVQARYPSV